MPEYKEEILNAHYKLTIISSEMILDKRFPEELLLPNSWLNNAAMVIAITNLEESAEKRFSARVTPVNFYLQCMKEAIKWTEEMLHGQQSSPMTS